MKFIIHTLVDITHTGARRGEDKHAYHQQQNFMSFFQTLSLRFNPILDEMPKLNKVNINELPFGSAYTGTQNVWTVRFYSESDIGVGIETLEDDFNYVPIIKDLDETVKLDMPVFRTQDSKYTNIILQFDDK